MKAIVVRAWGGPEVMRLEEMADPVAGPGEAVVRIEAAGVNPVDTYMRAGAYPVLPPLPCVLGGDAAGTVEVIGDGVTNLRAGQRVYVGGTVGGRSDGCYAEQVVRPADQVFPLPDAVSFSQGAAIGVPYATAAYALFHRGRAQAGETVFIHGASGAVGTAAIQLARAHGMKVIGSAGSDAGRKLVMDQGADHVLDHGSGDYLPSLRELTGGEGPDLILEMLANVNLAKDLSVVARRGRIVVIGNRGTIEINPRDAMVKDADILGLSLWNCGAEAMAAIHSDLISGLESGALNPVVGREMPLAEAAKAHEAVLAPGALGKIVLRP